MNLAIFKSPTIDKALSSFIDLSQADQLKNAGGKAEGLYQAMQLGLTVPKGFVIPNEVFLDFLETHRLNDFIQNTLKHLDWQNLQEVKQASERIRNHILQTGLDAELEAQLNHWQETRLPQFPLVVRSSAVGEDSGQNSFAGQLDSFLNIHCQTDLHQGLLKCWASYWSERALLYQHHKQVSLKGMAVVVQEQVDSQISGVLFTKDPEQAEAHDAPMRLEYCFGLADQLVSGDIHPGHISIASSKPKWEELESPEQSQENGNSQKLSAKTILKLRQIGKTLEQEKQCPQDIEWTLGKDGQIYVLQSRPITHFPGQTKTAEQVHWSNANINENFPEPVTPFVYSFVTEGYYHYFKNLALCLGVTPQKVEAMEFPLQNLIGAHGGRLYYNLTHIHQVLKLAPFGNRMVEAFDQFVGAESLNKNKTSQSILSSFKKRTADYLEVVRIVSKVIRQYAFISRRVNTFETRVDVFSSNTTPESLKEKTLDQLKDDLAAFLNIRFHEWKNASLADTAAMVCYWTLQKILSKEFPGDHQASLHNSLLKGLPDLVSNQPIIELWKLSKVITDDSRLLNLFQKKNSEDLLIAIETDPELSNFKYRFHKFLNDWDFVNPVN